MKYEYAIVLLLFHATKHILDTCCSNGWELVQVIPVLGSVKQLIGTSILTVDKTSSNFANRGLKKFELRVVLF